MKCPDCDSTTLVPVTWANGKGGHEFGAECPTCEFHATASDSRLIEAALLSKKDREESGE
jgi:hypothetical protein